MEELNVENLVIEQFKKLFACLDETIKIEKIAASGSNRQYFVICSTQQKCVATYSENVNENESFLYFSEQFAKHNLSVPKILATSADKKIYFQEYLGNISLFDKIGKRNHPELNDEQMQLCQQVLTDLSDFQIKAAVDFDFSKCFSAKKFDERLLRWDLNYFKYYFAKLSKVDFNEARLEDDFCQLIEYWNKIPSKYFVYRDFQSRNIMINNDKPYYIDYQGGIQGLLQYDVASFLYQARLALTDTDRLNLLNFYVDKISQKININKEIFVEQFYVVTFVRILQTLGAYGYRGLYEHKDHFLKSIPPAIKGLANIINKIPANLQIPELLQLCRTLTTINIESVLGLKKKLKVTVQSFAYRRGIPNDTTGNGGGFVFDCRAVPNPGIYEEYKKLLGNSEPVIKFFSDKPAMKNFLNYVFGLVDMHVERYLERNFDNMMVGFGCTGGQHRSVYAAEQLTQHLLKKYDVEVELHHIEQEMKQNQEHYQQSAK